MFQYIARLLGQVLIIRREKLIFKMLMVMLYYLSRLQILQYLWLDSYQDYNTFYMIIGTSSNVYAIVDISIL